MKYHKVFSLNSSLYVEKLKRIDLDHFDESGKMLRIPSEIFPPPLSKKLLLIISLVLVQKLSLLFCSSAWNFYLKLKYHYHKFGHTCQKFKNIHRAIYVPIFVPK